MSLSVVEAVAEKYPYSRIIFHGGEPLLRGVSFTREVIKKLGEREYLFQTNLVCEEGILKEWVPVFKEYFNSEIGTSLDTSRREVFEKILRNVVYLKKEKVSVVATITILPEDSPEDIVRIVGDFERAGGKGFYLQFATPVKTRPVSFRLIIDVWKRLYNHPLNLSAKRIRDAVKSGMMNGINGGNCAKAGVRTVDPDGEVFVCPDFAGQRIFSMGNILSSDFEDTVQNKGCFYFYEREKMLSLLCDENCWRLCRGGCASLAFFTRGLKNPLKNVSKNPSFSDYSDLEDIFDPYCRVYKAIFSMINTGEENLAGKKHFLL